MTTSNRDMFHVTGHLCGEFTGLRWGDSPVPGEFSAQRPATRSFDVFFDLRLNKRLNKQWWGWWFETPSPLLWRHRNVMDHGHCFKIFDIESLYTLYEIWSSKTMADTHYNGFHRITLVYHAVIVLLAIYYDIDTVSLPDENVNCCVIRMF